MNLRGRKFPTGIYIESREVSCVFPHPRFWIEQNVNIEHERRGKNKKKINIYYAYSAKRERIGVRKERVRICRAARKGSKEARRKRE